MRIDINALNFLTGAEALALWFETMDSPARSATQSEPCRKDGAGIGLLEALLHP